MARCVRPIAFIVLSGNTTPAPSGPTGATPTTPTTGKGRVTACAATFVTGPSPARIASG
ncbi:hypothetical protein [Phaeovulum sp.]|uniref:hypothetical protein n=1 Tax=Phaeovulum sp. TaxID=2934796 RepID=UPI0039E36CCE